MKLIKSTEVVSNLAISNLSVSDFKLAKSSFLANFGISTLVEFFKSAFVAYLDKSYWTLSFLPKGISLGKYSLMYTMSFLSTNY